MKNIKLFKAAFICGVSSLAIGCATVSPEYDTCEPVPPATDCGDDIPIEVE